jgi:adenylate cyclase
MTDRSKRKLLAILAADVVGYSRHVVRDEECTVNALRQHIAAVRPIIADFDGRVVDTAGDGVLAEFPSAVRATEAAIAIQRRVHDLGAEAASEDRLQFRIGVNVGDVMVEDDGILVMASMSQRVWSS